MNYIFLDTCVLLDISTKRSDLPLVSALEMLLSSNSVKLVLADLVVEEYERNKDSVAKKTTQRLSQEFKQVKAVVNEFAGEKQAATISVLNDINARLPLLTEANYSTIRRVERLIESAVVTAVSERSKIAAVHRGLEKRAPFHISKNSVADAVIIEQFFEFMCSLNSGYDTCIFVTHNHNDFSSKDHRKPHSDFDEIFAYSNSCYFNSLVSAIDYFDSDLLAEVEFEHDFSEETRGLREILDSMDELVDKVWYNRHQNRIWLIDNGRVEIVPKGTKRYGSDIIHEDVLQGAIKSAERIQGKYEDTGPWSDFEWGMLNGKLSALRWVLGDEWDMLDT
ncbi:PIN domain-containing protein [Cobetia sp. QF-1]|uniref:PIN domain-containing protein n=1 Tax=Cobetia sp. QF-1 TaxID=1969833 RepID=UPI000B544DF3|nr:PIN domain-containing protein [Cobetia sp. QF-1]